MATLGSLKANVIANCKDGRDEAVSDSRYIDAINDAVSFYVPEKLWFQEANFPVTVTGESITGLENFAFDEPFTASIIEGTYTRPLTRYSIGYRQWNNDYSSQPSGYVYDSGIFYLVPGTENSYNIILRGWKSYPTLLDNGLSNDFLIYAARMIEYKATSYMMPDDYGDDNRGSNYDLRAERELIQHRKTTQLKRRTGYMQPDGLGIYYRGYAVPPYSKEFI